MSWVEFSLPAAGEAARAGDRAVSANEEVSLAVVGIDYANADKAQSNRRFEMLLCQPGEMVELHLEPKNKHDERAVAVYSARGVQLGYLTAERCGWVGSKIKAGEECCAVFQEAAASAAIIRVRFNGGEPTLPPVRSRPQRAADAMDFIPDDDFNQDPGDCDWGA